MKILFILKERFYNYSSYGLVNSSSYIKDFLDESTDYESKIVSVIDYNGIDKEVFNYKPDIVIIEALWVSGGKIKELSSLSRYKDIKWIIRVHSDSGFLQVESMAFTYINDYISLNNPNVIVSLNNKDFATNLSTLMNYKFLYLPNVIKTNGLVKSINPIDSSIINVGCFGTLRILKNVLFQAICAINAANSLNKQLYFHINSPIEETNNSPVLKNLIQLFKSTNHKLISHTWLNSDDFNNLIQTMDIGLQISYTESFNIVAANFVINSKLIIGSDAISWMPDFFKVSTVDYQSLINKIIFVYKHKDNKLLKTLEYIYLSLYNNRAKLKWINFLKKSI